MALIRICRDHVFLLSNHFSFQPMNRTILAQDLFVKSRLSFYSVAGAVSLCFMLIMSGCSSASEVTSTVDPTSSPSPTPTHAYTPTSTPLRATIPAPKPTRTPTLTPTPTSTPSPTVTSAPTPTTALVPTATAVPSPSPTLTPMPTPTPLPTEPPPRRADGYEIEGVNWNIRGPDGDRVAVTLSVQVKNVGDINRVTDTPLMVSIDSDDSFEASYTPPLTAGSMATLVFDVRLTAGNHRLELMVDESVSIVVLEILSSDLTLAPISYQIVADGTVEIRAKVANIGSVSSAPISIATDNTQVATLPPLQAGSSKEVSFRIPMSIGRHTQSFSVNQDPREVELENNIASVNMDIDYVSLIVSADSAVTQGYNPDGSATVHITAKVQNLGLRDSGPFKVGIDCLDQRIEFCEGSVDVASLMPGQTLATVLAVSLPQGESLASVYAGEPDSGYRWGDKNVFPITVDVPIQPEIDLVFNAETEIRGYYSDSSAGVTITATMINKGARALPGTRDVLITCTSGDEVNQTCSTVMTFDMGSGYGPAKTSIELRTPPGEVRMTVAGVDISDTIELSVPRRIVDVERKLWNCVKRTAVSTKSPRGSCGGLQSDKITKWDPDSTVKWWINGDKAYIEEFEDALQELAPILNLEFQRMFQAEDANLVAYVGIEKGAAAGLGYAECDGVSGCSNYKINRNGFVDAADIVIFENNDPQYERLRLGTDVARHAMRHHLLRVLVPIGYRNVPDSILSIDKGLRIPKLSESDRALLKIYAHPMVKSGMTLKAVEELMVFSDDLLAADDASQNVEAMSNYEIIQEAFYQLQRTGSALYSMRGQWTGGTCEQDFGESQITIGEFRSYRALHYRMNDAAERLFVLLDEPNGRTEYWDGANQRWRTIKVADAQELTRETAWNPEYSDPLIMLASILWFIDEVEIRVNDRSSAEVSYSIDLNNAFVAPYWTDKIAIDANLTIDLKDYQLTDYDLDWDFDVRGLLCSDYYVNAKLINYGASLSIPSSVREGSRLLD